MRMSWRILAALILALALPSWAQAPARIGWLWPGSAEREAADYLLAFKQGMRENGLTEGRDFVLEQRFAEGRYERFPALVDELLKHDPAVILMVTIASVQAAQKATKAVPIVFVSTNDPVGSGLVESLAKPGGNTTGLSNQNEDLVPKYLELLRETLPHVSRIAVLSNPGNASNPKMAERLRDSAARLGIATRVFEATSPETLDATLSSLAEYRPDAMLSVPDSLISDQPNRVCGFPLRNGVPSFTFQSDMVASGCLMSYGTKRRELYRRAATYVKKILAGAKPADLPVEQPTKFELVINLKTAKALGLTIPQSVLLRADEVIQ
jgi:putative tryptophan/tyrosine transport system substrate-binding protein